MKKPKKFVKINYIIYLCDLEEVKVLIMLKPMCSMGYN